MPRCKFSELGLFIKRSVCFNLPKTDLLFNWAKSIGADKADQYINSFHAKSFTEYSRPIVSFACKHLLIHL